MLLIVASLCVCVSTCADANSCVISVGVQAWTRTHVHIPCVGVYWAHAKVIRQCNQHAAVIHEASQLTAIIQLPVSGEEQRCLETHSA